MSPSVIPEPHPVLRAIKAGAGALLELASLGLFILTVLQGGVILHHFVR